MDKKKVSEHWGNFHTKKRKKLSWAESETVKLYINKRISGNEHKNSYRMVIDEYGQFDRALIVGCGSGALERDLFRLGFFNEAVGVDIAEESLKLARKKSKEDGIDKIKYINLDLESKDLKKLGFFDVIIVNMVAHHIFNLNSFFKRITNLLTDSGRLIMQEYIGPNRFQHDKKTIRIINSILSVLDDNFKINQMPGSGLSIKNNYVPNTVEHFLATDPSEAINSEKIMSNFKKYFITESQRSFGGNVNHMLLSGIVDNFENSTNGKQILKLLMLFEELLEEYKVIKPDFTFVIGKKK